MITAASLYALILGATLVTSYLLAVRRRDGRVTLHGFRRFPGILRHFLGRISSEGMRSLGSAEMMTILIFLLLVLWLFVVGPVVAVLRRLT